MSSNLPKVFEQPEGYAKYVQVDGVFRFGDFNTDHLTLMAGEPSTTAQSAGFMYWSTDIDGNKQFTVSRGGSMTLQRGPLRDDGEKIAAQLGFKFVRTWQDL